MDLCRMLAVKHIIDPILSAWQDHPTLHTAPTTSSMSEGNTSMYFHSSSGAFCL